MERWKQLPEYPNYEVSDHGRIRNSRRERKPTKGNTGYYYVNWMVNGKLVTFLVHRLVAEAFCPREDPSHNIVAHNDGNKENNRWDNLRWTTQKDNMSDKKVHGTTYRGEKHLNSRVTEEQVIAIREKEILGQTVQSLAWEYGLSESAVYSIVRRRSWKHI